MARGPLRIAQVTPHPWEAAHEINVHVQRVGEELRRRGHEVVVLAPSGDGDRVRRSRAEIRRLRDRPTSLLQGDDLPVLAVGEALTDLPGGRRRQALPVDVTRTTEELMELLPLDVVHVHEPFAPSVASVALRTSRALNVGTFHAPTERALSTQVARRVVRLVFGRLDARLASYRATADLVARFFPGDYRVVRPGTDPVEHRRRGDAGPVRIAFADVEERAALRSFLRALRRVPGDAEWHATVLSDRGPSSSTPLTAALRERVDFVTSAQLDEVALLRECDVAVAASDGTLPAPGLVQLALATGAVPLVSRLAVYEELVADGERGLLFEPRDVELLGAQLARLVGEPGLRRALGEAAGDRPARSWQETVEELEQVYAGLAQRRHDPDPHPQLRRAVARRRRIDVDLHMHTDHSHDCATPVEVLLDTARQQGLGAIAITDHNEISGAFEAREKAEAYGVEVIVAEEIKTASQGEVIGLFLQEKIPRGLSLAETVAEIKRQGGLVYVPHPFDRMHSVPDYEHLLTIVEDIDAIEVYNARVAIGSFNEEAERFAAKYRIAAGAGSDAHVAQGLGSVRISMPSFDGPEEFMAALRESEIRTRPTSFLYVQALKFLETRATPAGARRAVRQRRVRRATRKA